MDPPPDPFLFRLFEGLPRKGPGSDACTERAYRCIADRVHRPDILDIGCGAGASALPLAALSSGNVVAVDIHRPYLKELLSVAVGSKTAPQLTPLQATMDRLPFRDGSFDVIWSEGAISAMGFAGGLRSWRPLLRDEGYLAVTELAWFRDDPPEEVRDFFLQGYPAMATDEDNRRVIAGAGFRLREAFRLPESAWRKEYYAPAARRIRKIREDEHLTPAAEEILSFMDLEIAMYDRYSASYGYVMYVMEKQGSITG